MPRFGPWLVCGCALMGGLLGDVATRHRCGGAACIGWPAVIVSDETICKAQRSMPDDPSTAGTAPSHAVLDLERFLPYRLSVLSNRVSQTIADFYVERLGLAVTEWRVIGGLRPFACPSAHCMGRPLAVDKTAENRHSGTRGVSHQE